ncbi:MAG: glycoside hydrolase family 3 protein [Microbacteriaceae bacterium]|nr:glycoside hydrolase family 3 protein [Microbacteriaceae bacterium]
MGVTTGKRVRALSLATAAIWAVSACTLPTPTPLEPQENLVLELAPAKDTASEEPAPEPAEASPPDGLEERIAVSIEQMDLRTKLAGLMVVTVGGMNPQVLRDFYERIPVAGFLLQRDNLVGDSFTIRDLISQVQGGSDFPLIMAVDQEGNPVARISGDEFPGARLLGAGSLEDTAAAFLARQQLVDRAGANVNFGIVADVSGGPGAYIHSRSFATDATVVASHVAVATIAQVPEVAQTLKHFPGHGMVFADSHRTIPTADLTYDQWRTTHALPFIAGIDAGVELVMTGHIRVPAVSKDPASVSDDWISILREDLGFEGVIITDDLRMLLSSGEAAFQDPALNAVAALAAGNDVVLTAVDPGVDPDYETYDEILLALENAVAKGVISEEQVDLSLARVLRLRSGLGTP